MTTLRDGVINGVPESPLYPVPPYLIFLELNMNFKLVFKSLGPKERTIYIFYINHNNFESP